MADPVEFFLEAAGKNVLSSATAHNLIAEIDEYHICIYIYV